MTFVLPLSDRRSAAHGHCWLLCRSDLLHWQTLSQQLPSLSAVPKSCTRVPQAGHNFILPKVLCPAGLGREGGSKVEHCAHLALGSRTSARELSGRAFVAVLVPVLTAVPAKCCHWDLVALLLVTLMQTELLQSECKQFQLSSLSQKKKKKMLGEIEKERKKMTLLCKS